MVSGGLIETIPLLPFTITLIMAVCGTIYVSRKDPPVEKRNKGLAVLAGISAILIAAVGLTYSHFRTEILFPFHTSIVQDERGRHPFHRDETNLSDYKPFSANNKLVKIESPTLSIDADYPKLHGALALYPVYAAAVEAVYHNLNDETKKYTDSIIRDGTSPAAFDSLFEAKNEERKRYGFYGKTFGETVTRSRE